MNIIDISVQLRLKPIKSCRLKEGSIFKGRPSILGILDGTYKGKDVEILTRRVLRSLNGREFLSNLADYEILRRMPLPKGFNKYFERKRNELLAQLKGVTNQ